MYLQLGKKNLKDKKKKKSGIKPLLERQTIFKDSIQKVFMEQNITTVENMSKNVAE